MKKEEKDLFWALSQCTCRDAAAIRRHLEQGHATAAVLGSLFWNRMAGTAYRVLRQNDCLGLTHREFRNALKGACQQNERQNESYFTCLRLLDGVLEPCRGRYAMLKGAYLCKAFPAGCRTANDVDLLVAREDVSAVGAALEAAGFAQGHVESGRFVPATRREIVASSMMRGETVPYIKQVDLPLLPFLEVDINFSLDYRNGDAAEIREWIAAARRVRLDDVEIVTLDPLDFCIHLCAHLYKEATTYPWVRMKRDMTLYKFADIHYLLADLTRRDALPLLQRIRARGAQEACYYALYCTKALFRMDNETLEALLSALLPDATAVLDAVQDPENHRVLWYTQSDVRRRFWHADRTALLAEI